MGVYVVKLPDIGEGVASAEIVEWHVAVDDPIKEDQILAAVMTDKATVEIPAPCDGKIMSLGGSIGDSLPVGGELLRMEVSGDPILIETKADRNEVDTATSVFTSQTAHVSAIIAADLENVSIRSPSPKTKILPNKDKPLAAPSVRQRAREAGIDIRQVQGSGPVGRISHDDLDRFVMAKETQTLSAAIGMPSKVKKEIPVVGLRRKISQRLSETMRSVVHFSYVEEIDVTDVEAFRDRLNVENPNKSKLTLLPFIIHALIKSVSDFPQFNAHYDDARDTIIQFGALHVGIATQTDQGLTVPVLRNAETHNLWSMADEIKRLASKAREGNAKREELSGSTLTISSLGTLGGIVSTPVINRPEVAILGVNKQVMRPVWLNDRFVPRLMMNISSSFDHRVVDGYDAARFIKRVKNLLEMPASLFV